MDKSEQLLQLINETKGLSIDRIGPVNNGVFYVTLNGVTYGYKPAGIDPTEMERKFKKMVGFSVGKAWAWLKKNAQHVYGGKSGEPVPGNIL